MDKRVLVPLVLLLGAAAAGTWYWRYGRPQQTADGDPTVYGNIDVRLVNLAFDASGRIAQMAVDEGAAVKSGEVLARLDTRRLQLALAAAQAKVMTQQENVRQMEAGTRPEEINKLRAELAAARTQAANLERSYKRIRDLEKKNLASSQQLEDAETASKAASDNVHSIEASLDLALAGPRKEEIAAAKATLAALQAEASLAETNLHEAELLAPSDGIVQSRILEPGDMASPDRPVFTLAMSEPLWARVYLPENILGKVKPGMGAEVYSDSFPGKTYRGWVGYISPSAEFTPKSVQTEDTRTDLVYQARIFVCNPQGELRLGMPVTVRLKRDQPGAAASGCGKGAKP